MLITYIYHSFLWIIILIDPLFFRFESDIEGRRKRGRGRGRRYYRIMWNKWETYIYISPIFINNYINRSFIFQIWKWYWRRKKKKKRILQYNMKQILITHIYIYIYHSFPWIIISTYRLFFRFECDIEEGRGRGRGREGYYHIMWNKC